MVSITGKTVSDRLQSMAPEGMPLQIPPACLLDMQGEPLEYEEGVSLSVRFPVLARYANPLGHMQGGYIVAALDNTLGPFSYLIAPPSVTSALNTQYLRPVTPETRFITCVARLTERTRATLYLAGEARNPEGEIVALCQAVCRILPAKN
ncbi:MAG: PaaI family thioesterase [Pseudoxanthomonas sp.]